MYLSVCLKWNCSYGVPLASTPCGVPYIQNCVVIHISRARPINISLTDERGVELDLAPLGGEGDGDVEDAGALLDVGLDGVDARRARHAADLGKNNENALIWRSAPGILRIPP